MSTQHPYTLTRRVRPRPTTSPAYAAPGDSDTRGPVRCKFCGQADLYWRETPLGYKLFAHNERHICDGMKRDADIRKMRETTNKVPTHLMIGTVQDEFFKLVPGNTVYTREQLEVIFERAKANAYQRYIG